MDADRKKIVFKHLYRHIYKGTVWKLWDYMDFNPKRRGATNVIYVKDMDFSKEPPSPELDFILKYKDIFCMSGDADITVLGKRGMHSFRNFSLMPCTGGLNNAKGRIKIQTFLIKLLDFYNTGNVNPLFRNVGGSYKDPKDKALALVRRKQCLTDYLLLLGDVEGYCSKIYGITNADTVFSLMYMDMSDMDKKNLFWADKEDFLNITLPTESLEWLNVDIEEVDDTLPIDSLEPRMFNKIK